LQPDFRLPGHQPRIPPLNPAVTEFRSQLADSHNNLGVLLAETGKTAESKHREAMAVQRKQADDHPSLSAFRSRLATSQVNLGALLSETGKPGEAEYRGALAHLERLTRESPSVTPFRSNLASTHVNIGILAAGRGNSLEAGAELRKAMVVFEKLAADNPTVTEFRELLAQNHLYLGIVLAAVGAAEVEAEYREALSLYQKPAQDNPEIAVHRNNVAKVLANLGDLIRPQDRPAEARELYERAVDLGERLVEDVPTNPRYRSLLAGSLRRRGLARREAGDLAVAANEARPAIGLLDGLEARSGEEWFETACCHATLACLAGRDGAKVPAVEAKGRTEKAMTLLRKAVDLGYRDTNAFRQNPAFDPLRDRADFRLLLKDVAMPADPFAH
jgi:tetratricopeptide (TPR) repeat protein